MLDLFNLKPEAFGLDISELSIKIAKLRRKKEFFELTSFGEEELSPEVIKNGEIKNEEALAKTIKKALAGISGEKIKTKYVVSDLPEEKSFCQVIQMPLMKKEELKSAVLFEAENYIPLPIDELYLDFEVIKPVYNHLDHLDVLIVATPKIIVNSYISCLKKSGLVPLAIEIEPQAIARALVKDEINTYPLILLDFEKTVTHFMIFSGYSLRFTSSIPISTRQLTEAISKSLKIDQEKAEKLKIKYGIKKRERDNEAEKIFQAVEPILRELVKEIKKYLDFYQVRDCHEHLPPDSHKKIKILICGGGADLSGIGDFLNEELKMPVELGNPWVNILPKSLKKKEKIFSLEQSLTFTTALGLALRGINYKNLFPLNYD